jgi:hypothetical protein
MASLRLPRFRPDVVAHEVVKSPNATASVNAAVTEKRP